MDRLDSFSLVGAGALGTHLASALSKHGLVPGGIASRTRASATTLVDMLGAGEVVAPDAATLAGSDVLLLCIPDDAIDQAATGLAASGASWKGRVVLHTSGARDAGALSALREKGAETGSFHPVQTFAGPPDEAFFRGITIGVEGSERALAVATHLADTVLADPLPLTAEDKALYHAAAVMGGNFAIALLGAAADVWDGAVHGRADFAKALGPLVRQSVQNTLKNGSGEALTGPFVRGDVRTIEHQLDALERHFPHLVPLYGSLAVESVHTAQRAGRLSTTDAVVLLDMIHSRMTPNG